jgi:hypothetical protein
VATRRFSIGPNERVEDIVEAVGAATVTKSIELTVDHQSNVKGTGNPRQTLDREEVLHALIQLEDYIQKVQWPPS